MSYAPPRSDVAAAAARIEQVVELLAGEPGLTAPEVAERLEVSRRHASMLLLRLEEHGVVGRDGRRWLVPAG